MILTIADILSVADLAALRAGSLLAYPSTTLHRVAPVLGGERLAAVGWAESRIRDAARRELLFDLDRARAALVAERGEGEATSLLAKTAANLLRMWAG